MKKKTKVKLSFIYADKQNGNIILVEYKPLNKTVVETLDGKVILNRITLLDSTEFEYIGNL